MSAKPKPEEPKSAEQFFSRMYRDLRAWNHQVPESAERADPVLRTLLQLYAHQLAGIDERIHMTWDVATGSLMKALAPEASRWPVPAFTVMRCEPADQVAEIDPHTKFFHKEKHEGGQTFFFSSQRTEKLLAARVRYVFLESGDALVNLTPSPDTTASPQLSDETPPILKDSPGRVFIAVEYEGSVSDFSNASLFLKADTDALRQMRWARWYPGTSLGGFYEDAGFCPGLITSIEGLLTSDRQRPAEWGGLRTSSDLFGMLEDNWVVLPESFAAAWETGPPDERLAALLGSAGLHLQPEDSRFYWIRIDLPPGGDKQSLLSPFEVLFDCFVVTNRNELTLFKHTGGNRLIEVELAESVDAILEIVSVVDSEGAEYRPRHRVQSREPQNSYTLEQRGDRLVLWFDFSASVELPPDSLIVTYTVTSGVAANGIAEGKITELYESHPGVLSVENVLPVRGAIPAKTDQQLVTEISARLRNRDRALTFSEISAWAMTFDPRIVKAECSNGIERARHGVRRCILVNVHVKQADFYSDDEMQLLTQRLARFLKSRTPVNTHFKVETAVQ